MRINFKGPFVTLDPIVIPFITPGSFSFDKTLYPDHIFYDVIVIGGGGGQGGGMAGTDPSHSGHAVKAFGGAGGGGGFHRRRGLLELLGATTTVLVGAKGADGADGTDTVPGDDGDDGGPSKFGDFVLATGGKGGKGVQAISMDESRHANGGQGGIGGTQSILAGGGALGGMCGLAPVDTGDVDAMVSSPGQTGKLITSGRFYIPSIDEHTLKGMVGKGGGGGPGGAYYLQSGNYYIQEPSAARGGKGSYNSDEDVYDPGTKPLMYSPVSGVSLRVLPGKGGGARVSPFNHTNAVYGRSSQDGAVFIRLSVEVDGSFG